MLSKHWIATTRGHCARVARAAGAAIGSKSRIEGAAWAPVLTVAAVAVGVMSADGRHDGRIDTGLKHGAFDGRNVYASAAPSAPAIDDSADAAASAVRLGAAALDGGASAKDASTPAATSPSGLPSAEGLAHAPVPAASNAAKLTREQGNVVRFIAKRYSVALDSAQHFVQEAYHAARDARVDPLLVLAVMSIESSFDPRAQSSQGAKGLMQVLARVHVDKFEPFGGAKAVFDPMANIRVGTGILKEYLARTGNVQAALKWYVGAALMNHDGGYGAKVLQERERIAAVAAGRPMPQDPAPVRMTVSTRAVPAAQVRKAESDAPADLGDEAPAAREMPFDEPALQLLTPGASRDARADAEDTSAPLRFVESGKALEDGI